jgi:hypothetical protein
MHEQRLATTALTAARGAEAAHAAIPLFYRFLAFFAAEQNEKV